MDQIELQERLKELKEELERTKSIQRKCELQDEIDLLTGEAQRRGHNLCNMDDEDCESCSG